MIAKISIITVVFNSNKLLESTIKSVINQSFVNFEYIIIDGGSNDGTIETIKRYQKNINYWISEKDQGIYDAMNKGLRVAKGEYILFLNAGDLFYDSATLSQIPFCSFPHADIFYGDTIIVDQIGTELGLRRKKLPKDLKWQDFKNGMVVCHQSIIVKREIAPEFDMKLHFSSDVDWVIKCLKKSNSIIFTNTIISRYLEGGATLDNHRKSLFERFSVMSSYFNIFVVLKAHLIFVLEYIAITIKLIPKYRNVDKL